LLSDVKIDLAVAFGLSGVYNPPEIFDLQFSIFNWQSEIGNRKLAQRGLKYG